MVEGGSGGWRGNRAAEDDEEEDGGLLMRLGGWAAKTQATEPDSGSQSKSGSRVQARPAQAQAPAVHPRAAN